MDEVVSVARTRELIAAGSRNIATTVRASVAHTCQEPAVRCRLCVFRIAMLSEKLDV